MNGSIVKRLDSAAVDMVARAMARRPSRAAGEGKMVGGIKARDRRAIRLESPPLFAPVTVMRSWRIPSEDKITRDNQKVA